MNKKLILVDESTEDLLATIDALEELTSEETIIEDSQNQTYLFLQRFKIKPGKHKIKLSDLYLLYSKSTIKPIPIRKFYKQLEELLTREDRSTFVNRNLDDLLAEIRPEYKKQDKVSAYMMRRYEKFLAEHNIIDGTDIYITEKALYYFFDKWAYGKKIKSSTFKGFKRLTPLYLNNKKHLTTEISYGLDKQFYDKISTEEIEKARDWAKKYKPSDKN